MVPRKIIIDTDPGCDDVLAMLLALSALPEELEVLLISVTYGNIDLQNCLRNTISLFHHVKREMSWRKAHGRKLGFKTLQKSKPIVAVGPSHPLMDDMLMADYFHGTDGLGGISDSHPHLSPEDTWDELLEAATMSSDPEQKAVVEEHKEADHLFRPSKTAAHLEILRLLRDNANDSITIVAIGPLTNLAMAAAEDPETFLRVKEVVVMGGNIDEVGNVTPCAEFNTFADTVAAARLYALSSPNPQTTMPPTPPAPPGKAPTEAPPPYLQPYPTKLSRQLKVTLFPLDITHQHKLLRGDFRRHAEPLIAAGSPLADWVNAWLSSTFSKMETLQSHTSGDAVGLELHDPLCIWYCIAQDDPKWTLTENGDIRVETSGQWTRGMCVVDRRSRRRREDDHEGEIAGDAGNWLSPRAGNRLGRCIGSPGPDIFGKYLLEKIFGP